MNAFYIRVTSVTNQQQIGIVGISANSTIFMKRIQGVFPPDQFNFDDFHVLSPLEIYAVHPSCKGILDDNVESLMVDCVNPILL